METWQKINRDAPNVQTWTLDNGKVLVKSKRHNDANRLEDTISRYCPYIEVVGQKDNGVVVRHT